MDWEKEETQFKQMIEDKDLMIVDIEMDGNCLFRAIAH